MPATYQNQTNFPWSFRGEPVVDPAETLAQDAGRTEDLLFYTVMGYDASEAKWNPLTDVTNEPRLGIFIGSDVDSADLAAGDQTDQPIVVEGHNLVLDRNQVVLENSLTLDSIVASGEHTIESLFHQLGITFKDSVAISEFENA